MVPCPSDDTLRRLVHESLDPAVFAEHEAHVAGCETCRQELGRLAREWPSTELDAPICLLERGRLPQIPGFAIERELGRGATAVVYLAFDQNLGRRVALKVMPGAHHSNRGARKRWRKEAWAFSRVTHPNVVALHHVGETDSWLYLVLEYVAGGTLAERLDGPVPVRDAAGLVATIAMAVEQIHNAGQVHLDLKPSNILLERGGDVPLDRAVPKVADFGVARLRLIAGPGSAEIGTTLVGPWGGTPSYMAPEQITGTRAELGPAADVHALGAVLYELLTGRPPFHGDSVLHTLDVVRGQDAVSPRLINPRVARDLETITLKCLRKDPKRRYESARALAHDLERYREGRPILARPLPRPERAWRWCRRRPAIALMAAMALVGFVALLGFYRRADDQRQRADAAQNEAEQNLAIASTVIGGLDQVLASTLQNADDPKVMVSAAKLLRKQIIRAGKLPGFERNHLLRLSEIDGLATQRLAETNRLDEARLLARERIDLLHECRAREPGRDDLVWKTADACLQAGELEKGVSRLAGALAYLEQGAALVANTASADPERRRLTLSASAAYVDLADRLSQAGQANDFKRARDGQRRLFGLADDDHPERPDLVLFKACLLADRGEWTRACAMVEPLCSLSHRTPVDADETRLASEWAMSGWCARELRHRDSDRCINRAALGSVDQVGAGIVSRMANMGESFRFEKRQTASIVYRVADLLLAREACERRRLGQLREADRTVAFMTTLARAMIQTFPDCAVSHALLSEAFMQQSKNAWKRADMPAIRRGLELSIESLNQAMLRDPHDGQTRNRLLDHITRMAKLPKT